MSPWTPQQLAEFKELVAMINATGMNNPNRPIGRTRMRAFQAEHGKELCDAMWEHLEKGGK